MYFFITVLFLILFRVYMKSIHVDCSSKKRLDGKTCIVTGGTNGMGLETAKDLAKRGARVIIACPFPQEGLDAQETIINDTGNQKVIFKHLDLASLQATRDFAQDILKSEERLDILVNNAGIPFNNKLTKDGMRYTMQVNYYGHFLLTNLLLPLLKKSGTPQEKSRIVNVASFFYHTGRYDFDNMNRPGLRSFLQCYGNSKLCVLLFTLALSKRLEGSNVLVNAVDPGPTGTRTLFIMNFGSVCGLLLTLFVKFFFKNPREGAQNTIYASVDESLNDGASGRLFRNCKEISIWSYGRDPRAAEHLWEESMKLVKIN